MQIILNALRLKPLEQVLPAAEEAGVGIIARVPLASGLLSGKYDESTTFADDDHRNYNRDGSAFDVGETFSGVPYDVGLQAAADFTRLVGESSPGSLTPAQAAIAGCGSRPVSAPSSPVPATRSRRGPTRRPARHATSGVEFIDGVRRIYDERVRETGPRPLVTAAREAWVTARAHPRRWRAQ